MVERLIQTQSKWYYQLFQAVSSNYAEFSTNDYRHWWQR